jgi:hypothetical protein
VIGGRRPRIAQGRRLMLGKAEPARVKSAKVVYDV